MASWALMVGKSLLTTESRIGSLARAKNAAQEKKSWQLPHLTCCTQCKWQHPNIEHLFCELLPIRASWAQSSQARSIKNPNVPLVFKCNQATTKRKDYSHKTNTIVICIVVNYLFYILQVHADETKSSLQFASRALRVTNCACVNEVLTCFCCQLDTISIHRAIIA